MKKNLTMLFLMPVLSFIYHTNSLCMDRAASHAHGVIIKRYQRQLVGENRWTPALALGTSPQARQLILEAVVANDDVTLLADLADHYQLNFATLFIGEHANTLAHLAAMYGSLQCLHYVLQRAPCLSHNRNTIGHTPLITALIWSVQVDRLPGVCACVLRLVTAATPLSVDGVGDLRAVARTLAHHLPTRRTTPTRKAKLESHETFIRIIGELQEAFTTTDEEEASADVFLPWRNARAKFEYHYPDAAAAVRAVYAAPPPEPRSPTAPTA
jgi:hypothetical protein